MTIYIEYIILDNFVIDFLLLKATLKLTGKTVKKGRLFCCSFVASILALLAPLLYHLKVISLVYKLLSALLIVAILRKFDGVKDYYKTLCVFLAVSLFTGGVVFAIFFALNLPYSTDTAISLMVLPVYLGINFTISLVNFLSRKASERKLLFQVQLTLKGKVVNGKGFLDTGNRVYDRGVPVIFIDKRLASEFIDTSLFNLRKIEVGTIAGKTTKICFTADKMQIYLSDGEHTYYNVTVAVADLGGQEYSFILHPDYEEVKNAG